MITCGLCSTTYKYQHDTHAHQRSVFNGKTQTCFHLMKNARWVAVDIISACLLVKSYMICWGWQSLEARRTSLHLHKPHAFHIRPLVRCSHNRCFQRALLAPLMHNSTELITSSHLWIYVWNICSNYKEIKWLYYYSTLHEGC